MSWEGAAVRSARIGQHADKVRLVLDLAQPVAKHEVRAADGGVEVWLGEAMAAPEKADANLAEMPAAPAEMPEKMQAAAEPAPMPEAAEEVPAAAEAQAAQEPAAEAEAVPAAADHAPAAVPVKGLAHVQSVHFESLPGIDRVVISLDAERPAKIVEPDPQTAIVLISSAAIDPANERRVDT